MIKRVIKEWTHFCTLPATSIYYWKPLFFVKNQFLYSDYLCPALRKLYVSIYFWIMVIGLNEFISAKSILVLDLLEAFFTFKSFSQVVYGIFIAEPA